MQNRMEQWLSLFRQGGKIRWGDPHWRQELDDLTLALTRLEEVSARLRHPRPFEDQLTYYAGKMSEGQGHQTWRAFVDQPTLPNLLRFISAVYQGTRRLADQDATAPPPKATGRPPANPPIEGEGGVYRGVWLDARQLAAMAFEDEKRTWTREEYQAHVEEVRKRKGWAGPERVGDIIKGDSHE